MKNQNNMDEAKKMFAITEAKDLLAEINNAISKTRDKSWQLLAFLIAVNVYVVTSIIEGKSTYLTLGLSLICLVYDIIIGKHLHFCMFPNKLYSNGGYPDKINETIDQEKQPNGIDFFKVLTSNYQFSIDQNSDVLRKMTDKYKKALNGLIFLVGAVLIFTLIFFMFVEHNKLSIGS